MAIESTCAKLISGYDADCVVSARRYYQQAVVINKTDIETYTVSLPDVALETCAYNVEFTLKAGKTGYLFRGASAGGSFLGSYSKSRSDLGQAQYAHNVQLLVLGVAEASKCILSALDKGLYVVAMQLTDGTVEIFGMDNGLTTTDYDYNVQEGGGGSIIPLQSLDVAPENNLPLVYKSAVPGGENADFDSLFAQPALP